MKDIYISVVVPIYNVEQYIEECLNSLLAQTLKNIEVLLVNDGTDDNSGKIAEEYAKRYPEIFRYFVKENGGLSDARNYAFPYIKGKYVAYVDSDDYIAPNMLEKLWDSAQSNDAEIVECELYKVYSDKSERINLPHSYSGIKDYMLNSRVCAWNKLYKVEWLKKIGCFTRICACFIKLCRILRLCLSLCMNRCTFTVSARVRFLVIPINVFCSYIMFLIVFLVFTANEDFQTSMVIPRNINIYARCFAVF